MTRGRTNTPADVWLHIDQSAGPDACWPWTRSTTLAGYGLFRVRGTLTTAHRVAYEVTVSPVAEGLELDHLCRTRSCCNPAHLEPVTHAENVRRSFAARGFKVGAA